MADPNPGTDAGRVTGKDRATSDRGLGGASAVVGNLPQTKTSMSTAAPTELRPAAKPPWIVKRIDVLHLAGTAVDAGAALAGASKIWSQCHIAFEMVSETWFDAAETARLLGGRVGDPPEKLIVIVNPDEESASMRSLRAEWFNRRKGDMAVVFAPKVKLTTNGSPHAADPAIDYNLVYIGASESPTAWILAHELGHRLLGAFLPHYTLESPLMHENAVGVDIVELECRAARGDAQAQGQLFQRIR